MIPPDLVLPPGGLARRRLHVIVIVQNTTDLAGPLLEVINSGLDRLMHDLAQWESRQARTDVLVRAITFAGEARWHIEQATPVCELRWPPVSEADGRNDTASALKLAASGISEDRVTPGDFDPALLLISADSPGSDQRQVDEALASLNAIPSGQRACRLAIAVGARYQRSFLTEFVTTPRRNGPIFAAEAAADIGDAIAKAGENIAARFADTTPTPHS